jgi:hypothetical protein
MVKGTDIDEVLNTHFKHEEGLKPMDEKCSNCEGEATRKIGETLLCDRLSCWENYIMENSIELEEAPE